MYVYYYYIISVISPMGSLCATALAFFHSPFTIGGGQIFLKGSNNQTGKTRKLGWGLPWPCVQSANSCGKNVTGTFGWWGSVSRRPQRSRPGVGSVYLGSLCLPILEWKRFLLPPSHSRVEMSSQVLCCCHCCWELDFASPPPLPRR